MPSTGAGDAGLNFDEIINEPISKQSSAKPRDIKSRDELFEVPATSQESCQESQESCQESQESCQESDLLPDLNNLVTRGAIVQGDWKLNFYSKGNLYTASAAVGGKIITSKFEVFDNLLDWLQNITKEKFTLNEAYQMVDYDGISLMELTMNLDSFSRRVPVIKEPIVKRINPLLRKLKKLTFRIHNMEAGIKMIGCHSNQEIIECLLDKD